MEVKKNDTANSLTSDELTEMLRNAEVKDDDTLIGNDVRQYDEYDEYEEYDDREEEQDYQEYDYGDQWTEEDSWDAMTDGQYGEYSGGVDWDRMMDCLGY